MEPRGKLISFEGGEGTGKSTQTRLLKSALEARGKRVVLTREPGGSPGAEEIRKLVVDTALEHHLVSPYTSLVAVDKTPARSAAAALERRNIENTMPAGGEWQAALPQTATPGPLLRWLGAIALLAAASLLLGSRLPFARRAS